MRISDWSSDVCSSDLFDRPRRDWLTGRGGEGHFPSLVTFPHFRERENGSEQTYGRRAFGRALGVWSVGAARHHRHFGLPGDRALGPGGGVRLALCDRPVRSEEHTSELQSLMRISYAVFCL